MAGQRKKHIEVLLFNVPFMDSPILHNHKITNGSMISWANPTDEIIPFCSSPSKAQDETIFVEFGCDLIVRLGWRPELLLPGNGRGNRGS